MGLDGLMELDVLGPVEKDFSLRNPARLFLVCLRMLVIELKLNQIWIMTCCEDHIGIEANVVASSLIGRFLFVLLALLT
jgi:hypothetical protein